jgi:riboflavin kinase / FMN adenylyltransferase
MDAQRPKGPNWWKLPSCSKSATFMASTLVVIGNFDGVHRGHLAVLSSAVNEGAKKSLEPVVLTFDPHPAVVLRGAEPQVLTTALRRSELITRAFPAVRVVVEPFTRELSLLTAREFVEQLLLTRLQASAVVVGGNFRFGKGREGDVATLTKLGEELGFSARGEKLEADDAGAFSSSRARRAILAGDVREAASVLGRPHAVSGVVIRGDGRGKTIGIPTANLGEVPELLPKNGVYSCVVDRIGTDGKATVLARGVSNIGVRPTVGGGLSIEAHLFDFNADLYGTRLRVHLVDRLRDEQRFTGVDQLVEQIQRDIARARTDLVTVEADPSAGGAWF